ncbi:MAG: transglycosylase SLT domain-containing protein [Pseudomonadota bacterium]
MKHILCIVFILLTLQPTDKYCLADVVSHAQYHDMIRTVSRETGLEAKVIMAVIKQESNWDPLAVSSSGALGLMQVMPESAEEVGIPGSNLFDPYLNTLAGSRYLIKMYEQFSNWGEALAAYYMGPGRFEKKELKKEHWRNLSRYLRAIRGHMKNYERFQAQLDGAKNQESTVPKLKT